MKLALVKCLWGFFCLVDIAPDAFSKAHAIFGVVAIATGIGYFIWGYRHIKRLTEPPRIIVTSNDARFGWEGRSPW